MTTTDTDAAETLADLHQRLTDARATERALTAEYGDLITRLLVTNTLTAANIQQITGRSRAMVFRYQQNRLAELAADAFETAADAASYLARWANTTDGGTVEAGAVPHDHAVQRDAISRAHQAASDAGDDRALVLVVAAARRLDYARAAAADDDTDDA